jgi:cystathionine gamma-synthase
MQRAIYDFAVTVGLTPSPYECWLAERGLYTFPLRYDRAEANARWRLADHLASIPKVARVLYPGRADHPDAAAPAALLGARTGNMVSFEITATRRRPTGWSGRAATALRADAWAMWARR